ncbi:hypothetical protein JOE48_005117 [Methylobacterium sp. PvR107]|nr:hypothetical protein [Methylobacterium sp. PvR107]
MSALLLEQLADPACAWSLGSYGAVATFCRNLGEAVQTLADGRLGLITGRGAVALTASPDLRPFAYETGFSDGWSHAVALCLPQNACAMGRRTVLTELGPDRAAARPQDRAAILFDLGLGLEAVDACVRVAEPAAVAGLRARIGRPILAAGNTLGPALAALSPHRVFVARFGRIEVYTPIPPAGGTTPPGPHSHVLPQLLRLRRTHAATAPIPLGWVPCGSLHPRHPCRDETGRPVAFDAARHVAFGYLLEAWGDPGLAALRRAVLAGHEPDPRSVTTRAARSAIRAAQAQRRVMPG